MGDSRFVAQDKRIEERFVAQNIALSGGNGQAPCLAGRALHAELNGLTNTLEKFLKRLTDTEEEFVFMKHDIKRIKAVVSLR